MAKKILIADDSGMFRRMLRELFAAEADCKISAEATNGEEAIELAAKQALELFILDLSMQVMGGLEASRVLKAVMPGIPIILFTRHRDLLDDGMDLPVLRVVAKSGGDALLDHVRELVPA